MKKLIVALVLACTSSAAHASSWWMLPPLAGQKPTRSMFFADKSSIQDFGGFRRVWLTAVFENPSSPDLRTYVELDCKQSRYNQLQEVRIFKNGKQVQSGPSTQWQFIAPDTPMRVIADNVCPNAFYGGIRIPEQMTPAGFAESWFERND